MTHLCAIAAEAKFHAHWLSMIFSENREPADRHPEGEGCLGEAHDPRGPGARGSDTCMSELLTNLEELGNE
jgi:hypothetical protein